MPWLHFCGSKKLSPFFFLSLHLVFCLHGILTSCTAIGRFTCVQSNSSRFCKETSHQVPHHDLMSRESEGKTLIRLTLPLWIVLFGVSSKHRHTLSDITFAWRGLWSAFEQLHTKVNAYLNKRQEKRSIFVRNLAKRPRLVAFQITGRPPRRHQSIVKALQHLIFLRAELSRTPGGMQRMLGRVSQQFQRDKSLEAE